ncbi:MAG TPA: hypothetical protein VMW69_07425, partial [Spirochaetia bacterium]|nr:hypothetical protein [Spirochaetia bacterium]
MEINTWMNDFLPGIVEGLKDSIEKGYHAKAGEHMGLSGRIEIYEVLDSLLSVFFPGIYSTEK